MWSWIARWWRRFDPSIAMKERRALFLSTRTALSDEGFLARVQCEDEAVARVIVFLRRMSGEICSVHPHMIYPSDRTEDLERIMDWGQELFGYWMRSVDCGEWNPYEFGLMLACELSRAGIDCSKLSGPRPLPPFGRSPDYGWKNKRPETFGEWVEQAARMIVEALPAGSHDLLPEYPEGTEDAFAN